MPKICIYREHQPRLSWAHKGLPGEKFVEVTDEQYDYLMRSDYELQKRDQTLDELYDAI